MKTLWQYTAGVVGTMVLSANLAYGASPAESFSATYSSSTKAPAAGAMAMGQKGTIWFANGKIRTEYLDEGHVMAHIIDPVHQTIYLMVPDQGFFEDDSKGGIPALPRTAPKVWIYDVANPCTSEPGATCMRIGADSVGGRACETWQFGRDAHSWTVCIDKSNGIVLRKSDGEQLFELTRLKVGKVNPKLFELPPNLKKGGFTIMPSGLKPEAPAPGNSPPADPTSAPSVPPAQSGR